MPGKSLEGPQVDLPCSSQEKSPRGWKNRNHLNQQKIYDQLSRMLNSRTVWFHANNSQWLSKIPHYVARLFSKLIVVVAVVFKVSPVLKAVVVALSTLGHSCSTTTKPFSI